MNRKNGPVRSLSVSRWLGVFLLFFLGKLFIGEFLAVIKTDSTQTTVHVYLVSFLSLVKLHFLEGTALKLHRIAFLSHDFVGVDSSTGSLLEVAVHVDLDEVFALILRGFFFRLRLFGVL